MLNFHELQLHTKAPVYVQIALYVKRKILLRETFSGDRLPSRREIAMQLEVNPNTVQKAFKLMEDEGYVRTSSTQGSEIHVDDDAYARIESELTRELVSAFIVSAKEIRLPFKQVVDLISELWD